MKILLCVASIILAVHGLTEHEHWTSFKQNHNKSYSIVEEKIRFQIFKNNLKKIEEHNEKYKKGESSYYMGINKFTDMTPKEFSDILRYRVDTNSQINKTFEKFPENLQVSELVDWREQGAVLDVKDQGQCGSCWAFSTTGALEGQNAIVNNVKIPLSEQELMDCSRLYENAGCNGGLPRQAFEYVQYNGISSESSYPYQPERDLICKKSKDDIILKIKGYKRVDQSDDALKNAIATIGPISVAIYAEPIQLYEGGIFDDADSCPNNVGLLDHAVLAVGYGSEEGNDYWLVKNSWGQQWGENGYFRLHRNSSICGILLDTSYPYLN